MHGLKAIVIVASVSISLASCESPRVDPWVVSDERNDAWAFYLDDIAKQDSETPATLEEAVSPERVQRIARTLDKTGRRRVPQDQREQLDGEALYVAVYPFIIQGTKARPTLLAGMRSSNRNIRAGAYVGMMAIYPVLLIYYPDQPAESPENQAALAEWERATAQMEQREPVEEPPRPDAFRK